jgi:predicted TIM-barrel fold metal-dependent hydrolase
VIEPERPIVDPHHHLWDRVGPMTGLAAQIGPRHPRTRVTALRSRYLLDELLADLRSGHNVVATVFVQCSSMYRQSGPEHLRPIGETEFVQTVAAASVTGPGDVPRVCAGIVGHADCMLGDRIDEVLEGHLAASRRFRGIRHIAAFDPDPDVLGPSSRRVTGLYVSDAFRAGFARLAKYRLSFDAWLLEPQLPELLDLARRSPDTPIILDHVGTPLGLASYDGKRAERFAIWRDNIRKLAVLPQMNVKLGGLAMALCNFPSFLSDPRAPATQLASEWAPYLETCIEAFGPSRCMFESNFPVDLGSCDYRTLWDAFKIFAKGYSTDEKTQLFAGVASRVYRLDIE